MRKARAGDHWRHILDIGKKRSLRTRSLRYQNVLGLGEGSIQLHQALTVICGANGVGKSTVLSICSLTLDHDSADDRSKRRHQTVTAEIEVCCPSVDAVRKYLVNETVTSRPSPSELQLNVYYLDAASEWFQIRYLVEGEANWSELLAQHEPRELTTIELKQLKQLSGKPYTSCKVYEIEEFDERIIPYCIVSVDNAEYSLEEMGAGEGALFLSWFRLSQMRSPGILLLEEPETHITPQSQLALMDLIAEKCDSNICCILTTHSRDIISYTHRDCLRLIARHNNDVKIIGSPGESQLELILGVSVTKLLIVLVEDRCARLVAQELLRIFHSHLSSQIHVAIAGGESEVINAITHYPPGLPSPRLLGVLDGDMRSKFKNVEMLKGHIYRGHKHPLEFLPWSNAPDQFLRENCGDNIEGIAKLLHVSESDVFAILSTMSGLDHHDWLEQFAKHANVSYENMVLVLLHLAMQKKEIEEACKDFANRLAQHVRST